MSNKLNIVQVITREQYRGAEVFVFLLTRELRRRGHSVTLVSLYAAKDAQVSAEGASPVCLDGRPSKLSFETVRKLADVIRSVRPDVVQANGSDTLKYSALARVVSRGDWPLVYRNIGTASDWANSTAKRVWGRLLMSQVDRVASVSESTASDFRKTYALPSDRVRVLQRGVEVPEDGVLGTYRRELLAATGVPADARIVVHVGSFSPEKNHAGLIEAFRLAQGRNLSAHLVLIGAGPLEQEVRRQVAESGLSSRVHFLGLRKNAADLAGGADLFVLPSHSEGLPGVLLEAGARAVPFVATDVGGVGEVACHGKNGLVVPPRNAAALADAMVQLLTDDGTRTALARSAREHVKSNFSIERSAGRFESLYREALGGPREA